MPDVHVGEPLLRRPDEGPLAPGQLRLAIGAGVVALDEVQPQPAVLGVRDVDADCTVSGIAEVRSNHEYDNYYSIGTGGNNSTSSTGYDLSNIPDWWMRSTWYFFEQYSTQSSTPLEFAVYFTTYFVEVYDLDSE